jgi:signal transduction histidine kinase
MTGRYWLATALLGGVLSVSAGGASAATAPRRVLILSAETPGLPAASVVRQGLISVLRQDGAEPVEIQEETIDTTRYAGEEYDRTLAALYRAKYGLAPPALVITVADPALDFARRHRAELFPNAPILFGVVEERVARARSNGPSVTGVLVGLGARATIELALRLHPVARRVVVVAGTSVFDQVWLNAIRQDLRALESRVPVTYLPARTFSEMLADVAALRNDAIVLFTTMALDGAGVPRVGTDVAEALRRSAVVPVYGISSNYLGHGVLGGAMVDLALHGQELGRRARAILSGAVPDGLPLVTTGNLVAFDARELKRFHVDEAQLPPHSDVRFREVTFWDQHQWAAITVVSVVVIQSALISGLWFQRVRRRRAEGALRDTKSALRVSDRRVQSLAGRLITAQEVERSRIARELHDDLSQKLALLSIELEQFVGDGATSEIVKGRARAASARAAEIATDVHNLSHELHPARLEMLGLAPALRGLCDEMSSSHNIEIEFERAPVPGSIPYEVSLCLFRVAQEGLRNVVRHSGARRATVTLWHADGLLALQIADAGRGFTPERASDGLGLVSMRERALLVGARFMVQSQQGRGTRVAVTVPVTWAGAPPVGASQLPGRTEGISPAIRHLA